MVETREESKGQKDKGAHEKKARCACEGCRVNRCSVTVGAHPV